MSRSPYRPTQVRAKTNQVIEHHYDDAKPGKPLYLLVPGGLIAVTSLVLVIVVAYQTFYQENLSSELGIGLMLLLAPFYVGGVFLFSYGYELYDVPKAIRLTAIIVFITLASVIIVAVLFLVLGSLSKGKSKSSSRSNSSSRSSVSSSSSGGRTGGRLLDGIGPLFVDISPTRTVTHEIVREVPTAPPAPQAIRCEHCGRSYVPEENEFACPNCGAPTPEEFLPQQSDSSEGK